MMRIRRILLYWWLVMWSCDGIVTTGIRGILPSMMILMMTVAVSVTITVHTTFSDILILLLIPLLL